MATAWLPFAGGLIGDCSLSEQRDRLLRDRGSLDGKRKRSSRKNSQREGMSGLERKRQVGFCDERRSPAGLSLSPHVIRVLPSFLFQLVDFEAMTAPGSEAFSKIAKSWMNLKR